MKHHLVYHNTKVNDCRDTAYLIKNNKAIKKQYLPIKEFSFQTNILKMQSHNPFKQN